MPEWLKWSFDGVGGAALVAAVVYLLSRKSNSGGDSGGKATTQTSSSSLIDSTKVERDTVQDNDFQVVQGSQNVTQIAIHNPVSSVLAIIIVIFVVVCLFYFGSKLMGAIDKMVAEPSVKTDSQSFPMDESTTLETVTTCLVFTHPTGMQVSSEPLWSCVEDGVVCMIESEFSSKSVRVPRAFLSPRFRIGITLYPSSEMETCSVEVETSDPTVSLDHVNQKDGVIHSSVSFTDRYVETTAERGTPWVFYVDITARHRSKIPLEVTVGGGGFKTHVVTTTLILPVS